MEKRKLSALPRPEATAEMVEMADRLDGMEHIVTAELVDDNKILLLNFYEVSKLKKGKTEAAFRTFLSSDDYITQDLSQSKVKWLTAAFDNMQGFRLWEYKWDQKTWKSEHIPKVFIWTAEDNDETFICWDRYKKDVWVRQPPSFAIRTHPLLRPRIDAYQDFLPRICSGGITITGIRTAESVQRLQNIATMLRAGKTMTNKHQVFPIYDWTNNDVWLYLLREKVDIPEIYS